MSNPPDPPAPDPDYIVIIPNCWTCGHHQGERFSVSCSLRPGAPLPEAEVCEKWYDQRTRTTPTPQTPDNDDPPASAALLQHYLRQLAEVETELKTRQKKPFEKKSEKG